MAIERVEVTIGCPSQALGRCCYFCGTPGRTRNGAPERFIDTGRVHSTPPPIGQEVGYGIGETIGHVAICETCHNHHSRMLGNPTPADIETTKQELAFSESERARVIAELDELTRRHERLCETLGVAPAISPAEPAPVTA